MSIHLRLLAMALGYALAVHPAFSEEIRDYYAEPGINPFKETLNQNFNESVDPFSGTLQLKYTDVHLPGNGGMDVNVTRTYTSLQTNAYPIMNRNGLGWTMNFGRIVTSRTHLNKMCAQPMYALTTKENPSLELPDGGRELLVLSSLHNDGTLITRSNWIARCTGAQGMVVTAPDGTRYTMDRFDNFQDEPSFLTTRIEDVHGNWIAIDYATNAVGINYIDQIRRSEEDGIVVKFEYEDQDSPGIAVSAIVAGAQRWVYEYELISGFMFPYYKQLVRVIRPDGRRWVYTYNPKVSDPNPNDDIVEDGIASYSLTRVTYPHGATIDYTYHYVQFDPGSAEKTTSIKTKIVSGSQVQGGTWTYQFAPYSAPYNDNHGGQLRHDVTTVTAPEATYRYVHMGKDYRPGAIGQTVFIRPSFVGLLIVKETFRRGSAGALVEREANSWGERKISEEDFWHGAGYRDWWRDDGTYVPVLQGKYVSRDSKITASSYAHAQLFSDFDEYGNPRRILDNSNIVDQPAYQKRITYFNDTAKWIIGLPDDEIHEQVLDSAETGAGTIEREYDAFGKLLSIVEFGEETRYSYHASGDLHTVRDARGNTTRYSDYKRGIARIEERPETVVLRRVVNDSGTLQSETNGRGFTTSYDYDDLNRLTAIDYPIKADVSIDYQSSNGAQLRVLTRGNYRQTETINDFGQTLRIERHDLATGQTIYRTSRFDAFGREVFSSYPNATIGNTMIYDALGRIERITHPDNTFVRYQHDDARVTVTNERNFSTEYLYLILGTGYANDMPVRIAEPENVGTLITRNVFGDVTRVFQGERLTDGSVRGHGKTYRYDSALRLVESDEREVGLTVYGHDEVGNVISERVNNLPATTFVLMAVQNRPFLAMARTSFALIVLT